MSFSTSSKPQLLSFSNLPFFSPAPPRLRPSTHSLSLSSSFAKLSLSSKVVCRSTYNVQVVVGDNEPEERLIQRFRREVFRAGIIQESKRRRYFENTQEKQKRKVRDAARRNRRRRRPPAKADKLNGGVEEEEKKKKERRGMMRQMITGSFLETFFRR